MESRVILKEYKDIEYKAEIYFMSLDCSAPLTLYDIASPLAVSKDFLTPGSILIG